MSLSNQHVSRVNEGEKLRPYTDVRFLWFWTANTIAAFGVWVQNAASSWVMTDLAPDPMMVSLVQAAAQLPILLLAIPAGALADLMERKWYLLLTNAAMVSAAAVLAAMAALGRVASVVLLALTCLLAMGTALNGPAWAASLPLVVPRPALTQALVLNAVGFNFARAIGPALGGLLLAAAGAAAAFMLNVTCLVLVAAIIGLLLRLPGPSRVEGIPPEPLWSAIRIGPAYVMSEPVVRNALVRTSAFFGFASAIWALLPLYSRQVLGLSSASFGMMMGLIGIGAVVGGLLTRSLQSRFSRNNLVMLAGAVCGVALIPIALLPRPTIVGSALVIFGIGWITGASGLQATVQLASAPWVRARTLALYQAVFNGAMGFGAIFWGWIAEYAGLVGTLVAAGLLGVLTALMMRAVSLPSDIEDPSASAFPADRMVTIAKEMTKLLTSSRHRLVVAISYHVNPSDTSAFRAAMAQVRAARSRDGATGWILSHDVTEPMHWIETFHIRDWHELQRALARINPVDNAAVEHARTFHRGSTPPRIRLLLRE